MRRGVRTTEITSPTWAEAERTLERSTLLDDVERAALWRSLLDGRLTVRASRRSCASVLILAPVPRASPLDARSRVVAELVGDGLSYKEIAFELGVSNATVWRSMGTACRALGVGDRLDLAVLAAALGPRASARRSVRRALLEHDGLELVVLAASMADSPVWSRLSEAERAVAELALAGHRGAAIARLRGARSPRTIANQLEHVFRKAGVSGRVQLASRLLAG